MAKKKRKKIPARTILRRLHNKADKAISLYVRAITEIEYGACAICLKNPIQCCFHFVRRGRKVLRWHLPNLVGTCHRCNYIEYRNPDISRAWYIRRHGADRYLALVDRSMTNFEPTPEFLQGVIDNFTVQLKNLYK